MDHGLEHRAALDAEPAGHHRAQCLRDLGLLDRREEAQVTGVDAQDGHPGSGGFAGDAEHGAVAPEDQQQVAAAGEIPGGRHRLDRSDAGELGGGLVAEHLAAVASELRERLADDRDAAGFLGIGDQADPAEGVSGLLHAIRWR